MNFWEVVDEDDDQDKEEMKAPSRIISTDCLGMVKSLALPSIGVGATTADG